MYWTFLTVRGHHLFVNLECILSAGILWCSENKRIVIELHRERRYINIYIQYNTKKAQKRREDMYVKMGEGKITLRNLADKFS